MAKKDIPQNVADYEVAFFDLMKHKKYKKDVSVEDRIRHLVFAMVDPVCPLNYYMNGNPPAVTTVVYLVAEEEERKANHTVRDTLFRLSGRLGLINPTAGRTNIRIRVPEAMEFAEINLLREQLEAIAFLKVHNLEDKKKERAVSELRTANRQVEVVAKSCDDVDKKHWEDRCKTDPYFADKADDFWARDADFHTTAFDETNLGLGAELIRMLLERMRLTASNRYEILKRIPGPTGSHQEHEEIIDAVAVPATGKDSEQAVTDALHRHLDSASKHFGLDKK